MTDTSRLTVLCPDCDSRLIVDTATGEVLDHQPAKRPIAGGKDFDTLLQDLDRGKEEAEEIFEREVAAFKDRDRLLDEKFREAMKRAEKESDDEPPLRPWDLD